MVRRWFRWIAGGRNNDSHEDRSPVEDRSTIEELSRKEMPFRWGPYTLLRHLGTDGLVETFVATEATGGGSDSTPASPENTAKELRIVSRGLIMVSSNPYLRLFLDEMNIFQQLDHPQVCRLLRAGDHEGIPIIVSEFAMGRRLSELLAHTRVSKEPLPWTVAVYIAHELCSILEYLHAKQDRDGNNWNLVAFRGFSSADIYLGYAGEVRIADLGIRTITLNQAFPMLPEGWAVLDHRPVYLSPETVRGEAPSQASDIFCVGWLLWELATACRLFAGAGDIETLTKIRDAEVQAPRELNPAIPSQVEEIILKALARDPAGRHASAADLRRLLAATSDPGSARAALAELMRSVFADQLRKTNEELLRWARYCSC